jgi:hypothetical protein
MVEETTARQHLDWATERAPEYFDDGDKRNAFASFLSDVGKHDGTRWIQAFPATFMLLEDGWRGGREHFKQQLSGFSVAD